MIEFTQGQSDEVSYAPPLCDDASPPFEPREVLRAHLIGLGCGVSIVLGTTWVVCALLRLL